eukprot:GEMP01106156.1.p2 GENE.GEMP01106156.1~~GEMP01106156.1.p2  ORF type:complete len:133 (+),score=16.78 GEMP01106156.1:37-435(+)
MECVYFEHGGCGVDNGCSCCLRLEYSPFLFSGTCTLHTARSIAPPLIVPFPVSLHACFVKCGRVPFCPAIAYDDLTHQCLLYVGFPMASVFVGVVQKTLACRGFGAIMAWFHLPGRGMKACASNAQRMEMEM